MICGKRRIAFECNICFETVCVESKDKLVGFKLFNECELSGLFKLHFCFCLSGL